MHTRPTSATIRYSDLIVQAHFYGRLDCKGLIVDKNCSTKVPELQSSFVCVSLPIHSLSVLQRDISGLLLGLS